ncbi:hypothetical protein C7S16_6376 [Burkholderia thailandensis]|uniref:Uncharacterized protein n=1 Tax=Burkholderia thailandensis TaxID=57975 RepID=A0AAW9CW26_BURTH|nr:hypothetical protein [Burkholderia thailandensis]MDW9252859.1 hypothetical protein [Burkholderia thailandensis]
MLRSRRTENGTGSIAGSCTLNIPLRSSRTSSAYPTGPPYRILIPLCEPNNQLGIFRFDPHRVHLQPKI